MFTRSADTGAVPTYRDEAIVLRTHKLGEADRIVTMLGRSRGKIRAVAKGVRRTGSRFGARLEPFMLVDLQCYEGRSLDTVTQAVTIGSYGADIAADYARYTAASAIVEAADRLTEHDEGFRGGGRSVDLGGQDGMSQQFALLVGALRSLARAEHAPGLTLDSYLLRALSIAGWAPSLDDCAVTGEPGPHTTFVIQSGGVVSDRVAPPGAPRVDPMTLTLLAALRDGDWQIVEASDERTRGRATGLIAAYAQYHLERGLKSLPLVDRAPA